MTAPCPGIIILCHTRLDRVAQVARFWAWAGCPVAIHVDAATPDAAARDLACALADLPAVRFMPRRRCEWGTWPIVEATLAAAACLIADFPAVRHVCLTSGACLPIRPVAELAAMLARHPDTDFIESVRAGPSGWVQGGLEGERFDYWFPFGWRRARWRFDAAVALQRRLGLRRRRPAGIVPHLGAQWWCLTRDTLRGILEDPRRPAHDRYFRHVWIPDESYFQTLARRHARRISAELPTLARFDARGRPYVFHDDHLGNLRASRHYLARKIWPDAEGLYRAFLGSAAEPDRVTPARPVRLGAPLPPEAASRALAGALECRPGGGEGNEDISASRPHPQPAEELLASACDRPERGRAGLCNPGRYPDPPLGLPRSAAPFWALGGHEALVPGAAAWLATASGAEVHGHLFARRAVHFAGGGAVGPGALPAAPAWRDEAPADFLRNLVWAGRGRPQAFLFGPADRLRFVEEMARDPNGRIRIIAGAWALGLFRDERLKPRQALRQAIVLARIEAACLARLAAPGGRASVEVVELDRALADPAGLMVRLAAEIAVASDCAPSRFPAAPDAATRGAFAAFLARLRDGGAPLRPALRAIAGTASVPAGPTAATPPDRNPR